jgi:hypothetical protein
VFLSHSSGRARAQLHSPRSTPSVHSAIPSTGLFPAINYQIFAPDFFINILHFIAADCSADIQQLTAADCLGPDAMGLRQRCRFFPLIDAIRHRPTAPCDTVRTSSHGGCASVMAAAAREPSSMGAQ